jgi:hypothetical protein
MIVQLPEYGLASRAQRAAVEDPPATRPLVVALDELTPPASGA